MPYIPKDKRPPMDEVVSLMMMNNVRPNGTLNYVLCSHFKRLKLESYNDIKNYLAELNEAAEEIRRRFLVEREKEKMRENGDI